MNLERIKKDLDHQTRNGRKNIYIKVDDLNELVQGAKKEVRGKGRIYINIQAINQLIDAYEQNRTPAEKERDEFLKRIHVDMPDYKLTRIDEYGFKFEPIKEDRER